MSAPVLSTCVSSLWSGEGGVRRTSAVASPTSASAKKACSSDMWVYLNPVSSRVDQHVAIGMPTEAVQQPGARTRPRRRAALICRCTRTLRDLTQFEVIRAI